MNIGIITTSNENLILFKYLNIYNHNYHIYYYQNEQDLNDKDFLYGKEKIQTAIEYLIHKGCDKVIIDPIFELYLLQEELLHHKSIIPLFKTYLHNYIFKYSLIGKIGILGDFLPLQKAQKLLTKEEKNYMLSKQQKQIKKFHFPFKYRCKETRMRKYFLNNLSYSNYMVNKIIKFDLRYFKNANVDTIIPLNYGYFHYEKTISNYFNFNHQRFHRQDKLAQILAEYITSEQTSKYTVTIYHNGHTHFLTNNKYICYLLQKGNKTPIHFIPLS